MADINEKQESGSPVAIVPIDFTPNDGKGKSFSLKLGWVHLFLGVFLTLSATAAWFS